MTITVNGQAVSVPDGASLQVFLEQSSYNQKRIAVERNLEIVPKDRYADTMLQEGDRLEVVSFVGGG